MMQSTTTAESPTSVEGSTTITLDETATVISTEKLTTLDIIQETTRYDPFTTTEETTRQDPDGPITNPTDIIVPVGFPTPQKYPTLKKQSKISEK